MSHLLALESDPRPPGNQKLHGHDGYRLRVGDYRILYTVDDYNRHVEVHATRAAAGVEVADRAPLGPLRVGESGMARASS